MPQRYGQRFSVLFLRTSCHRQKRQHQQAQNDSFFHVSVSPFRGGGKSPFSCPRPSHISCIRGLRRRRLPPPRHPAKVLRRAYGKHPGTDKAAYWSVWKAPSAACNRGSHAARLFARYRVGGVARPVATSYRNCRSYTSTLPSSFRSQAFAPAVGDWLGSVRYAYSA